ncbi:Alpha-amylase family protein [Labilithrix luteola]|uniref:Alpha-amylase family protein n=1 Tax=Labilithrix luteola TaxID=1391654 RepID=A0A0K1PTC1_9BACT|nr:alpha-amylase family glycosyl hydrolase [Labilithrix luteola]AKU96379.1 Alpha-amylase family protein [Labilithrix luteola]
MHARKTARDAYFPTRFDDAFFTARGDVTFRDTAAARVFADRVNDLDARSGDDMLRPAELAAMALVHEIFHVVIELYRQRNPRSFERLLERLDSQLEGGARRTLIRFLETFPTPAIYKQSQGEGDETPQKLLARDGRGAEDTYAEEVILLWLTNQNPAYEPVRPIVTDYDLGPSYQAMVGEARHFFAHEEPFGPRRQSLIDLLLEPSRKAPKSILDQLKFIEDEWGQSLGLDQLPIWRRVLWARDFLNEEGKYFYRGGPGPGSPLLDAMRFNRTEVEPKRFSQDLDWMPRVVLMAKTVYVWLDQLSKQYGREIHRLDQIPDEELDMLASRGFSGLWLIGLFERSSASKKIKQMRGDQDAVASAYSLKSYDIAWELGGHQAYENLRHRAWQRGIRLAADMVPNHVGIDADWIVNHPDWFIQTDHPPFPSYRFGGPDLSDDGRVGVFIEEGYWSKTDAAVVFRRHDRHTGHDRFIYHGNDGTSMPWNDTAQLDYTKAEVRQAVIETILHVARMFPIIRFDAAMTLAKRHFQRLWFPLPGSGGAIPSRSDYAMTQDEFDRKIPVEFWREVVDTVAQRAPDTLLLAEAFWMMEGYFVRSLGMHRVYNSAFMNMLKREENQKYRETIKNVLDFEPQILKRFVNFMNNPDEETAALQFGGDDKYFGVCVLMSTMPGLPMFGHGQVEGFHEKYGMEYRRAKWDEKPNHGFVERHEREIFPLLKKRYLFSGVDDFALYDFLTDGGVDEDVYAYSNGWGSERALVLYNNKFKDTRGRIRWSVGSKREDGSMLSRDVLEAIGVAGQSGAWVLFRDAAKNLEYLRRASDLEGGFYWELGAFKYHVLTDFRTEHVTAERPWDRLAEELGGQGVPSLERALVALRFRPVHQPLRQALGRGHVDYLLAGWDAKTREPTKEALAALDERLQHVADGLAWMRDTKVDATAALAKARTRFTTILRQLHPDAEAPDSFHLTASPAADGEVPPTKLDGALHLRWVELEAVVDLVAQVTQLENEPGARPGILDGWELSLPLLAAIGSDDYEAHQHIALVLLATALPEVPLREAMRASLSEARGRTFLGVHEANGVSWLSKERFEALANVLAEREVLDGRASLALARRQYEDVTRLAEREGYRTARIEKELDTPRLETPPSSAKERPLTPSS